MTLWHFFAAYAALGLLSWVAAVRAIGRTWWSLAAAVAPVAGAVVWLGLWVRMDWEEAFLDQAAWVLVVHAGLLLLLGAVVVQTWRAASRRPLRRHHPARS